MNLLFLIILLFISLFFIYVEKKYLNVDFKWVFIVPFCIIIATRDPRVPDTEAYLEFFNSTDSSTFDDFGNFSFEIGFQILTKFLKIVSGENFHIFLGYIALINSLIICFSIKRIEKFYYRELNSKLIKNIEVTYFSILPLVLYISYYGIYLNAIVLRVGLSLSIFVFITSILIKVKKNIFDYLVIFSLFILAYFIHSTSLLGIPLFFLLNLKIKFCRSQYLWIVVSLGVIYFSNIFLLLGGSLFSMLTSLNEIAIVASKMSSYESNVINNSQGVSIKFVFYWIMAIVLIFNNTSSDIYFKYLNAYLFGLLIFALFRSIILIERVTDFYLLYSFVVYYLFLLNQKSYKFWFFILLIITFQLIFVIRITN